MTHIWVSKLTISGSDNGLSPGRRLAIIWTSAVILLIRPLVTNFSEILIRNQTFSFTKMHFKMLFWNRVYFVSSSMCFLTQVTNSTYFHFDLSFMVSCQFFLSKAFWNNIDLGVLQVDTSADALRQLYLSSSLSRILRCCNRAMADIIGYIQ